MFDSFVFLPLSTRAYFKGGLTLKSSSKITLGLILWVGLIIGKHGTYYIPKFRLIRLQKSFSYTGVKIWNNIEKEIKLQTINKFFKNYKNNLVQEY